ncbi:MAG TPA: extensin family protein [Afifellaceae bacterium]|nr:extensin family protein [Afifellaceae bacterium]
MLLAALTALSAPAWAQSDAAQSEAAQAEAQPAEEETGGSVSKPEPKPPMLIAKPESNPKLPRPRPERATDVLLDSTGTAATGDSQMTTGTVPPAVAGEDEACLWRLRGLGVAVEPQAPIEGESACRLAMPLQVSELSADISLFPQATLDCATAEAVTKWMHEVVVPSARRYLDAEPTGLVHSSAFDCSDRNLDPGNGEHAAGQAIDITYINFRDRDTLAIRLREAEDDPERDFQQAIRAGACGIFSQVIGPGANAGFAGKLHLGTAQGDDSHQICR